MSQAEKKADIKKKKKRQETFLVKREHIIKL